MTRYVMEAYTQFHKIHKIHKIHKNIKFPYHITGDCGMMSDELGWGDIYCAALFVISFSSDYFQREKE